jgi:hypothetical protein
MIYYIACTATHRVKIGYTSGEPEVRLKQLQTGSASSLRLIACHPGSSTDEREIHARLAASRVRGEWFETSEDVLSYISAAVMMSVFERITNGECLPYWAVCAVRALRDQNGFLPPEIEAVL